MSVEAADQLKKTVESRHGGKATLFYVAHVIDMHALGIVADGYVHVFDLEGHPEATRAYAWRAHIEGRSEIHSVLDRPGVRSAAEAVRLAPKRSP